MSDPRPSARDGLVLLIVATLVFVVIFFWLAVSKVMRPTGYWLVDWMREDQYYCILVPLSAVPITQLARYLRWFTNSLFRYN